MPDQPVCPDRRDQKQQVQIMSCREVWLLLGGFRDFPEMVMSPIELSSLYPHLLLQQDKGDFNLMRGPEPLGVTEYG